LEILTALGWGEMLEGEDFVLMLKSALKEQLRSTPQRHQRFRLAFAVFEANPVTSHKPTHHYRSEVNECASAFINSAN
jgi:hypothetical protein